MFITAIKYHNISADKSQVLGISMSTTVFLFYTHTMCGGVANL